MRDPLATGKFISLEPWEQVIHSYHIPSFLSPCPYPFPSPPLSHFLGSFLLSRVEVMGAKTHLEKIAIKFRSQIIPNST